MQPYFMWRGIDSRSMGVMVEAYPSIQMPKQRLSTITIPGRQGVLTLPEIAGKRMYDERLLPIKCYLRPEADLSAVMDWLSGSGMLALGCDPSHGYKGRITNPINFDIIVHSGSFRRFTLPVACEPFVYSYPPQDIEINMLSGSTHATAGSMQVDNPGWDAPCVMRIIGHGEMWFGLRQPDDVRRSVHIQGMTNGMLIDFGSAAAFDLSADGKSLQLATHKLTMYRDQAVTDEVFELLHGVTLIDMEAINGGWCQQVTVLPEWRWMG